MWCICYSYSFVLFQALSLEKQYSSFSTVEAKKMFSLLESNSVMLFGVERAPCTTNYIPSYLKKLVSQVP